MTSSAAASPAPRALPDYPGAPVSSDEDLMLSFADGDAGAFDRLYARHRGPLFRYIQRQCGSRPVAEELFQDVWMSLIGARERYQPQSKFTTYLYTLARHRVIDHARRQNVRAEVDSAATEDQIELAPDPVADPARSVEAMRQVSRLLALVESLPAAQREVILLRAEGDLSLDEMARVTASERETVKSRLRYALDKLRRGMEGYL